MEHDYASMLDEVKKEQKNVKMPNHAKLLIKNQVFKTVVALFPY